MAKRLTESNLTDWMQDVEDRLKRLEYNTISRVLPEQYRFVRIGASLYIRNIETATDTLIA